MQNIHVTKTLIKNSDFSELDFDLYDEFGFDHDNYDEFEKVEVVPMVIL